MASSARELTPRAREIVDAARALLEEEGAAALSMRRVAERVGIRAPSLYKHLPDKAALEAALVSAGFEESATAFEAAVDGADEPLVALANPAILEASDERETADEGCLSLGMASVVVPVERPVAVVVEGRTPAGEELRIDAEGLEARVLQHEIDHLDGVLTLERTTDEGRRRALAELRLQPVLG